MRGKKLTGWGKNGPAYFFPGERMGRPILSPGKELTGGKFLPVTPGRWQSKRLLLSMNVGQNSKKHEFLIAICRLTGGIWQLKTLFLVIFDQPSSIVKSVLNCCLSRVRTHTNNIPAIHKP